MLIKKARREKSPNSNRRIIALLIFFCVLVSLILARLFSIQVLNHSKYRAMGQEQYWKSEEIPSRRGSLLSSDGYPLATTEISYLLYLEPKRIENKNETASLLGKKLAELNKFDVEDPFSFYHDRVLNSANKDLYWIKIIGNLTPEEKGQIEELNLKGLGFEEEPLRYYPEGELASHVLGFVASNEKGEKVGYFGVEGTFNHDLRGKQGKIVQENDALGAPIIVGGYTRIDPINGRNLVLTIDRGVQYIIEKHLQEGVQKMDALSGSVIVMEPFTGDVIAMANYPTYDPANFNDFEGNVKEDGRRSPVMRRNVAVSNSYEPGSVLKGLTVAAGVDKGIIKPESTFVDAGPVRYSDYVIDNWNGQHHGTQTIVQLLQKSNNIGAAWVGHQVGAKGIHEYFTNFGLGAKSGIELEGEDTGIVRPLEIWTDIDLANISFGQGISTTPLQVLNAFNVFANGGVLMRPRVVSEIHEDGKIIKLAPKEIRRVISPETAETMNYMLTQAVTGGESRAFNEKSYDIAGKTGTAQIPKDGKYDPHKTNATFVGYLSNSKKFSMIVRIEEPRSSIYAAETAVPLWMNIARDLVKYYGIPVDRAEDSVIPTQIVAVEDSSPNAQVNGTSP